MAIEVVRITPLILCENVQTFSTHPDVIVGRSFCSSLPILAFKNKHHNGKPRKMQNFLPTIIHCEMCVVCGQTIMNEDVSQ